MKIKKTGSTTKVWLSQNDTFRWSHRPNAQWPCSTISDKRVYVELDKANDIVEVKINGRNAKDLDSHELRCCLNDLTKGK